MAVTRGNLALYLSLVADFRLNRELAAASTAFLDGLLALIEQQWLQMFNDRELQQLISGAAKGLDIKDLRANVELGGGYHAGHPVVDRLWHVLEALDTGQQAAFLKFVTGCSRCGLPALCPLGLSLPVTMPRCLAHVAVWVERSQVLQSDAALIECERLHGR